MSLPSVWLVAECQQFALPFRPKWGIPCPFLLVSSMGDHSFANSGNPDLHTLLNCPTACTSGYPLQLETIECCYIPTTGKTKGPPPFFSIVPVKCMVASQNLRQLKTLPPPIGPSLCQGASTGVQEGPSLCMLVQCHGLHSCTTAFGCVLRPEMAALFASLSVAANVHMLPTSIAWWTHICFFCFCI